MRLQLPDQRAARNGWAPQYNPSTLMNSYLIIKKKKTKNKIGNAHNTQNHATRHKSAVQWQINMLR